MNNFPGSFLNILRQIQIAELPFDSFHHETAAVSRPIKVSNIFGIRVVEDFARGLLRRFQENLLWWLVVSIMSILEE